MSHTPRTDDQIGYDGSTMSAIRIEFARQLERELNASSKERDDALMMLGMYRMKSDEQTQRIKRLEDIINRAHLAFFSDSSDRKVSIAMHRILDEEVRKESP